MVIKLTVSQTRPHPFFDLECLFLFLGQRSKDHVIGRHALLALIDLVYTAIILQYRHHTTSQFLQRQVLKLLAMYRTRMLVSVEIVDVNFRNHGDPE